MMLAVAGVLLAVLTAAPADVKGKWEGTVQAQRDDGSLDEDSALMILDQKDTAITGSLGGHENDQHPIVSGTVDGRKVTIVARSGNGREYKLELTLENDTMTGTITSGDKTGKVEVRRRRE